MLSAQELKVLDEKLRVGSSGDGVSSVVLAVEDLVCLSTRKELAGSGGRHGPPRWSDKPQQPSQHNDTRSSEALHGPMKMLWPT